MGPCCAGLSFGFPCALAQCPVNAYNALVKRHLARPVNLAREKFPNVFLLGLKKRFKLAYDMAMKTPIGEGAHWRVGRGQAKLAMIDRSKLYDNLKLTKTSAMVKFEVSSKIPKKARIIQAHRNEATAYHYPEEYQALGEALKAVGQEQFEAHGVTFSFHYAGGLNHDEMSDIFSEWMTRPNVVLDECDGANWDATMQEPTLTAEALVYAMVGARAALDVLVRNGLVSGKVRCRLMQRLKSDKHFVRYVTYMRRLSGDFNTSLGNTMISMMICYVAITELPSHLKPYRVDALFMGDDYLAAYAFQQAPPLLDLKLALDSGWSSMGVTPERGLFAEPCAVTFISMGVWPRVGGGYQFVPQPAKQLVKLFWSAKRLTVKQARAVANGIAIAFWPVYYGMPLMMRFLKAHYRPGEASIKWDHYFSDMLTKRDRNVDWSRGFTIRYGVPLRAATFDLPPVTERASVMAHPLVEMMLRIESADPMDRRTCLA